MIKILFAIVIGVFSSIVSRKLGFEMGGITADSYWLCSISIIIAYAIGVITGSIK
jgi:amino acid transporter